ncbi:Non-ribosomal peptide synthetase [Chitinispirillum alkaliphilum]|nr:Non-ribosomal peptide synthetase [Chitinispirillum alkaliphilum]
MNSLNKGPFYPGRSNLIKNEEYSSNTNTLSLTPMQQGMFFNAGYKEGSGDHILQIECRIREAIDVGHLKSSWDTLLSMHSVLHSGFLWKGNEGIAQFKCDCKHAYFSVHDISSFPEVQREEAIRKFLFEDRKREFKLDEPPLMRVTLFCLDKESYIQIWTFHHIILDGRSIPVILERLFSIYAAIIENRTIQLPELPPFENYLEWLKRYDHQAAVAFWEKYLKGITSITPIPANTHKYTEGDQKTGHSVICFDLSPALTHDMVRFAKELDITPYTILHGMWSVLLYAYSGESEILFGTVRSCRSKNVSGSSDMLGLLMNTVPVRTKIDGDMDVLEWLRSIRKDQITIRQHCHASLIDIQKVSEIHGGQTLFETILIFEKYSLDTRMRSLSKTWHKRNFSVHEQTGYPLSLFAYQDTSMHFKLEYDCSRYSKKTASVLCKRITALIAEIVQCREKKLRDLSLLVPEERGLIREMCKKTVKPFLSDTCIHRLFEEAALLYPERTAVVHGESSISFGALNKLANRVAYKLLSLGVKRGSFIGVNADQSIATVAAILATFKAGGAYVPIDPEFPESRIQFMASDANINILLTDGSDSLPMSDTVIIDVSDYMDNSKTVKEDNPPLEVSSDSAAYVIYTSGSTGQPKGVIISHRNVMNFFSGMDDIIKYDKSSVWLAATTLSFDISVLEILWTLTRGIQIVLLSNIGRRKYKKSDKKTERIGSDSEIDNSGSFSSLVHKHSVTHFQCTPSMARMLITDPESAFALKRLRTMLVGGEALPLALASDLKKVLGGELLNMYGPTETTIWSTAHNVSGDLEHGVAIGSPIANTSVYIFNNNGQLVPPNVVGELFIGGEGVAAGYHNRPELTSDKFVTKSSELFSNEKLYKTGDLAGISENGILNFYGRTDYQVKIRGHRIELGEIEELLMRHPDIIEAALTVTTDDPDDIRMNAYYICKEGLDLSGKDVSHYLRELLPEYMVPARYIQLKSFPLTPNKKVDRKALPTPEKMKPDASIAESGSEMEKAVADIWKSILKIEDVCTSDNFFDLGGHSLLAMQLHNRLKKELFENLTLTDIFQYPTIRSFICYLNGKNVKKALKKKCDIPVLSKRRHSRLSARKNP